MTTQSQHVRMISGNKRSKSEKDRFSEKLILVLLEELRIRE
jgi:hypothetical protein